MAKKKKRREPESLELALVGVETHAHLDMEDFDEDREAVLARARACGIASVGNVFLGPDAYDAKQHLFEGHPEVFFLMGVHPNEADELTDDALARMRERFQDDPRLKAVGEIGLDFYWDRVAPEVQRDAFRRQLVLARELELPVVIHSRDAHEATMEILVEEGFRDYPLLWHCFGGDTEQAREIIANGWHISLPGPVTYKANHDLHAAVSQLPLERMVVETDCPYLSPEPWRGKRNEPAYAVFTAERVALLKGISLADIWRILGENARRFFRLDQDGR
ncbi:TatD family hydrolase [Salidesulfovibrio onnuriiensis]|uniref:TatD family hydrolase n=1 Tax=Salidesulfovibrio onnuriiensis TaxID=2583823 RepID=UPI0011CA55E7|nr:TatD family hydrolase [Salidesulfovibrio onnuriiensis]